MIAPRDTPPITGDQPAGGTSPGERSEGPAGFTCLLCDAPMFGAHCKLHCPNCGYREDCSDLFPE